MKALFVKDLRIVMTQKRYGIIILIIGIIMSLTMTLTFDMLAGYFMMIAFMLATRTVDYDAMENGMPFLMTLPAGRQKYALEKYIFTYSTMALVGVAFTIFYFILKAFGIANTSVEDLLMSEIVLLCVGMLMGSVLFPLYLKFPAEKRQIVIVIFVGVIAILGSLFSFGLPYLAGNPDWEISRILSRVVEWLDSLSGILICASLLAVALAANAISVLISINIMKKREF